MDRKDWVLSVLYSPGKDSDFSEPVNGSLRIMKILFMLGQENKSLPSFYNKWQRYLYGPCDFDVYTDITSLKSEGLIEETMQPFQNFTTFSLTLRGKEKAQQIFTSLTPEIKKTMQEVKHAANTRYSMRNLLQYVYSRYPGWNSQSIFKVD